MGWTICGSNFGRCKRFFSSPKHSDRFWGQASLAINGCHYYFTGYSCRVVNLTTHLHPVPRLRMGGTNPLLPLYAFWCEREKCTFMYLIYRMNQEEKSIFAEVIVAATVRRSSHEHMFTSEWLPKYNCLNLLI